MRSVARWSGLAALGVLLVVPVQAQTADEVIEKHLAALGGRQALGKLQSRVSTGTITVSVQGTEISGPIESYAKAPNKSRTYFRLDLSQFGGAEMVVDQRCDGKTGFAGNSVQGDREITGNRLQTMLNASFPTPLLNYKEAGAKVELVGKDKVVARDAYVVRYIPKAGWIVTQSFDAETYLLLRMVLKVDAPEAGGEIEETVDPSDYREVDGVKVPFTVKVVNPMQSLTITFTKVEHNKPIDEAMFSKPAAK